MTSLENETVMWPTELAITTNYYAELDNMNNVTSMANVTTQQPNGEVPDLINNPLIQIIFSVLYIFIFILGIFGNFLVCFVVFRKRTMQTVTNFFITNLALAGHLNHFESIFNFNLIFQFMCRYSSGNILLTLHAHVHILWAMGVWDFSLPLGSFFSRLLCVPFNFNVNINSHRQVFRHYLPVPSPDEDPIMCLDNYYNMDCEHLVNRPLCVSF